MRYVITGGGTGGHIYPAIAVAQAVKTLDTDARVLYVGTQAGLESELVPRAGLEFAVIEAGGIMGKSAGKAFSGAMKASRGLVEALGIIRRFRPHVAMGTGGYVSGPVILTASLMGVPCAIQEQNAVPGFTNRVLSRLCRRVFTPFEGAGAGFPDPSKCVFTGNPVRREIVEATREEGARSLGLDPEKRTLFIFGGSRGARKIVDVAVEIIGGRLIPEDLQVLFVTGREYESLAKEALEGFGINHEEQGRLILRPYLFSIEHALAASDLIVGRAGGMTVSEVLARGLPSILIPSPNVAGNHQFYNARAAEMTGGSILIREAELNAKRLADVITGVISEPSRISLMALKAKQAGRPHATTTIARRLIEIGSRK